MEDILRFYLTNVRHEFTAAFPLASGHLKGAGWRSVRVRWEPFGKDPRQLGTGAFEPF
jgi:hypothetical protein